MRPDAETVAIPHILDGARKPGPSRVRGVTTLPGVGANWSYALGCIDRSHQQAMPMVHAAFFKAPLPLFFVSIARTNLSHFVIPARFSGM